MFPFCKTAPTNISITPHSFFLLYHFSLLLFLIKKKLRCFLTLGSTSWVNTVYYSQAYDARNSLIDHRRPNLTSWLVHECVTRCVTLLSFDMDNSDGKARCELGLPVDRSYQQTIKKCSESCEYPTHLLDRIITDNCRSFWHSDGSYVHK